MIVQVILDGHHLAPEIAQLVWRTAAGRMALVTDADRGGRHGRRAATSLGGVDVEIRGGAARRADGVLAGSVVTMIDSVRNCMRSARRSWTRSAPPPSSPHASPADPTSACSVPAAEADVVVLDDRARDPDGDPCRAGAVAA